MTAVADIVANGLLCLTAVMFAAHARKDQRAVAVQCSLVLLSVWALYVLSWTPYSLARNLTSLSGVKITSAELWAPIDALSGMAIVLIAGMAWWGWALWLLLFAQVLCHLTRQLFGTDFSFYSNVLDVLFLGQLAIFFLIGGRGVRNRIGRFADRLRLFGRKAASALARTRGGR